MVDLAYILKIKVLFHLIYCSFDFSDDYNNPIEVPLLVQSLTDQPFDVVPDYKADHVTERQIIVTQRSIDCEQFVQRRAQVMCAESNLQFMHCEDYDIKIVYVSIFVRLTPELF